ncbi:50S ribosomal protein L30 [Candidatus Neomarinimicrobiota bacterium]
MAKTEKTLRIKQIKSAIGYRKRAKGTLKALGIHRMHQTVEKPDNAAIRGMVEKVRHLVEVVKV